MRDICNKISIIQRIVKAIRQIRQQTAAFGTLTVTIVRAPEWLIDEKHLIEEIANVKCTVISK